MLAPRDRCTRDTVVEVAVQIGLAQDPGTGENQAGSSTAGQDLGPETNPTTSSQQLNTSTLHRWVTDTPALSTTGRCFSFPTPREIPHGRQLSTQQISSLSCSIDCFQTSVE